MFLIDICLCHTAVTVYVTPHNEGAFGMRLNWHINNVLVWKYFDTLPLAQAHAHPVLIHTELYPQLQYNT